MTVSLFGIPNQDRDFSGPRLPSNRLDFSESIEAAQIPAAHETDSSAVFRSAGTAAPWHQTRLQKAIELLEDKAPYYGLFVRDEIGHAECVLGNEQTHMNSETGALFLNVEDLAQWSTFDLAHQLVHLCMHAHLFRQGEPFRGVRAERLAYREQYLAVRRLAGDAYPEREDWRPFLAELEKRGALSRSSDVR